MTQAETIKILEMLDAFYASQKHDPKQQVIAWHLILQEFDYEDAWNAVLNYARNDEREYASFPAVGVIVKEIRKAQKRKNSLVSEIILGVSYGREYTAISDEAKALISEERYIEWLNMDAEQFQAKSGTYKQALQNKQKRLTE